MDFVNLFCCSNRPKDKNPLVGFQVDGWIHKWIGRNDNIKVMLKILFFGSNLEIIFYLEDYVFLFPDILQILITIYIQNGFWFFIPTNMRKVLLNCLIYTYANFSRSYFVVLICSAAHFRLSNYCHGRCLMYFMSVNNISINE